MKTQQKLFIPAIYVVSLLQMASIGISPAIAGIAQNFSGTDISKIQLLMTLPGLAVIFTSIGTGWLSGFIEKRKLVFAGIFLITLSGVLGFLFHDSIEILWMWSILMGIGTGLFNPMLASIVAENFSGEVRAKLTGKQGATVTLGGMILTFAGGLLCGFGWQYNYLVYLIGIVGLIFIVIGFPKDTSHMGTKKVKGKVSKNSLMYLIWVLMLVTLYHNIPTNISLFIQEKQFGNAAVSGSVITVLLLGGVIAGFIYGKLHKRFEDQMITIGFIFLTLGLLGLSVSTNIMMVYMSVFIAGMSVNFVMSQIIYQVGAKEGPTSMAMAIAFIVAVNNFGQFVSISMTKLSAFIWQDGLVSHRFVLCTIVGSVVLVASAIRNRKRSILL